MDDNAVSFLGLAIVAVFGLVFLGLFIWSIVWSYADAERRGKPGCLIALLVAFVSWPLSLLFWLIARPDDRRN